MRARFMGFVGFVGVSIALLVGPSGAEAVPPSVDRQWVAGVTASNATLNAEVALNGSQTYYELQIDTTGNFKFFQNSSCPISIAPMICLQVIVPGDPLPAGWCNRRSSFSPPLTKAGR